MLQKGAVDAAAEVLLELHDSDAAVGAVICERDEAAAFAFFDCHFGDHGDACASGHHGQNRGELSAFKNNVGLQTGASAGGEGVFAEAVAFFEQEKRIVLDVRERVHETNSDWPEPAAREVRGRRRQLGFD